MAASTITRVTWTDGSSGTVINNAVKNSDIYDKIDEMFAGAGSYATFTFGGKVRIEVALDLKGASSDPAVSASGDARLAYNTTSGYGVRVSLNGGAFKALSLPLYADPNYCGGTAFGAGRS